MIYTEKQVEDLVRQLMKDLKREYYEKNDIYISFENNIKIPVIDKVINNCWHIAVDVHDDQFNKDEPASILIFIDDDTLEIEGYLDCSMGRPVPMIAKKMDNGKYGLGFPEKK